MSVSSVVDVESSVTDVESSDADAVPDSSRIRPAAPPAISPAARPTAANFFFI